MFVQTSNPFQLHPTRSPKNNNNFQPILILALLGILGIIIVRIKTYKADPLDLDDTYGI